MNKGNHLRQKDKEHLWHPLTQHQTHTDCLPIVKAKGVWLYDAYGNKYIDGIASWYTCMYGHCNDFILKRVNHQMQQLDQVVFTGLTHQPAIEMATMLMQLLPSNQQKIFFSDNGSTTVDVAIKMAIQYHFNKGEKRHYLIAFENGFHGDTFGAMSVSGLSVYNGIFNDFFLEVERISVPNTSNKEDVIRQFKNIIDTKPVCAFIYEPLIQGAAGMKIYDATVLEKMLQIAHQKEVITIADEVMTGFGKTGKNFASLYLNTPPDIICMGKSLTGGLVSMGLTSCSKKIYDAFLSHSISKGFFHGHTYSANPLACTAALASMELLQSDTIQKNIVEITKQHQNFGEKMILHPMVKSTRQLGTIFALDLDIQMERYGNLRDTIFHYLMQQEIFLRPLGNTIYILPPFVITKKELNQIYNAIEKFLESHKHLKS